ncbi:MAG: BON domain-containing protein [Pseudomonadota bacterium]
MRLSILSLLLCSALLTSGCSSVLTTMDTGTIEDDPGERTMGQMLEDQNIETKATVNIHAANEAFDNTHINIISYNGFVLMVGQVPTQALKDQATDVVRNIRAVRRIYNELELAAPSSAMTRASDSWITAKVKSWLLGSSDIQGNRVKVVTEDGVVYLMGLATAAEAERISDTAAGISGVQRVVRLFEIIN